MRFMSHVLNHRLDHMLDYLLNHILDQMIISLVTMELHSRNTFSLKQKNVSFSLQVSLLG